MHLATVLLLVERQRPKQKENIEKKRQGKTDLGRPSSHTDDCRSVMWEEGGRGTILISHPFFRSLSRIPDGGCRHKYHQPLIKSNRTLLSDNQSKTKNRFPHTTKRPMYN